MITSRIAEGIVIELCICGDEDRRTKGLGSLIGSIIFI